MNLTRLDPRVKLFLLAGLSTAALAAHRLVTLPVLLVIVLLMLLGGRVKPSEIWIKLRGIFGLIAALFLLQCLFNRNGEALLSVFGLRLVTDFGFRTAVFVSLRLLIIVLSALIISTGEARDYLLSLSSLKVPYEIAFMVLAALRFLPMLRDEARDVLSAAQMRGLQIKKAGLKKQLSAYLNLTIPVVAGAMHRAESLSIAMEARGFRLYPKRTNMSVLHMRKADWVYIASFCLVIAAVFFFPLSQHQPAAPEAATVTSNASEPPQNSLSPAQTDSTPPQKTTILYFSDMQANPDVGDYSGLGELAALAFRDGAAPDAIIIGGDSVNDGGDEAEWQLFHNATGLWSDELVTASVVGNHDNYPLLAEQFDFPKKAPAEQGRGFFYTLSAGSVFFVMLDSNIMGAANEVDIRWLQETLQSDAAQQADWLIAVMHHPMWPVSVNPKDAERASIIRESFLPILEDFGVGLILCGHQHVYSRTLPMRGETAAEDGKGIVQVMAASGDKATYPPGGWDYIAATAPAPNYVLLSADGGSLVITAFDVENNAIDEFSIMK